MRGIPLVTSRSDDYVHRVTHRWGPRLSNWVPHQQIPNPILINDSPGDEQLKECLARAVDGLGALLPCELLEE